MKVKNTVPMPVPHMINYHADDFTIIMLGASKQHVDLMSIDPDTMGVISRYPVETDIIEQLDSHIDDSCVYLPTKLGQILALDKFSGEILTTVNAAMPIVSDLVGDDDSIYCVCGVPISRQWNLLVDNFSLCIFDKETGVKKVQSHYFTGTPCFLSVTNDYVWVVAGAYILKYAKDGELLKQAHLGVPMDYPPIITEDHVILVAANGIVRILNVDDLSFFTIIRAALCPFQPALEENELIWFTENGVCRVEYLEQVYKENKLNRTMNSSVELVGKDVFGCDLSGSLVNFNLESSETSAVKLSSDPLRKPIRVENYLFVASSMQLHQIEV